MVNYSRQTLAFLLHEVFEIESLCKASYFQNYDAHSISSILDSAAKIAEKYLSAAVFTASDRVAPAIENGKVSVHKGLHDFVKAYAEAGFLAATFDEKIGGMQMPKTLKAVTEFVHLSGHNSFLMFTDLVIGSAGLVAKYGTTEQQESILPKFFSGAWLSTMCLTEPQAGSSLAEVACKAIPQANGSYLIEGQKIFISAGDHDISENILHFVLARVPGSPPGVKGISLFIVPKFKFSDTSQANDVQTLSLFHKMGQKATPAVHLGFGAHGNCEGYLLGKENAGLLQMFDMMNTARLGVGLSGIAIASAAYHQSLQYAQERKQGKSLDPFQREQLPVPIIQHADVRRMLLTQKVIYEGGLALLLQNYFYLDMQRLEPENQKWAMLTDLLTPVSKTYGAEQGAVAVSQGLQVLGGYGYTTDFMLEQLYRDVRIMSIYEGTTGIQSLTLLGRQVAQSQGQAFLYFKEEIKEVLVQSKNHVALLPYVKILEDYLVDLEKVTNYLLSLPTATDMLADASLYMEYFSHICVGWQWLKVAQKASEKISHQQTDTAYYSSLIHSMQFYFSYELTKTAHLKELLLNPTKLTHYQADNEVLF